MRSILLTAFLVLTSYSMAHSQCPIGSYPTTNGDAQELCQGPLTQTPTLKGAPNCPPGYEWGVANSGNRSCVAVGGKERSGEWPERPLNSRIDARQ